MQLVIGNELDFLLRLGICLVCGFAIGIERELRNKPAGISTNCFVMGGACLFTFVSLGADSNSPARIAAQGRRLSRRRHDSQGHRRQDQEPHDRGIGGSRRRSGW